MLKDLVEGDSSRAENGAKAKFGASFGHHPLPCTVWQGSERINDLSLRRQNHPLLQGLVVRCTFLDATGIDPDVVVAVAASLGTSEVDLLPPLHLFHLRRGIANVFKEDFVLPLGVGEDGARGDVCRRRRI